jgi:hypothetical protein
MRGLVMTEADAIAHAQRHGLALDPALTVRTAPRGDLPEAFEQYLKATQALKPPRKVSKTEQRYATVLDVAKHEGHIKAWWHHPWKLWIAPGLSYEPDYVSQGRGLELLPLLQSQPVTLSPALTAAVCRFGSYGVTCIEVKHTFMFDKRRALDRLKTAASLYPMFRFKLCTWDTKRQTFIEEEIPAL